MKLMKQIILSIAAMLFVFDENTSDFTIRQIRACAAILIFLFAVCLVLVIVGVTVPSAITAGILFFLTLVIFVIVSFLPRAIVWGDGYKQAIDAVIGWLAFVGWLGMLHNTWLNFSTILIGLFVIIIFNKFLSKGKTSRIIPNIVLSIVTILTITSLLSWMAPDSYRASSRHLSSIIELLNTKQDRGSIINEGSQTTYGKLLKDVNVAYEVVDVDKNGNITKMRDIAVSISRDSVFLIIDNTKEPSMFEGQSFIEIKLPNSNGSFLTGKKMWIEADLIKFIDRKELE